ncbi:hypothetical protein FSP39_020707 [Pinctada imbricata]|uniref:Uncharacterized protein n=1 Tax=Pinctada imbricata TaxID=66713 RepID=A0AA89CC25_PINIB|nr:hypothetical protein FSP39_020707 [Pinctada imbricata]
MSVKLREAIEANDLPGVQSLVKLGEEVNKRGPDGKTVFQSAITDKVSPEILKFLLEEIDLTTRDENGDSVAEQIFKGNFSADVEAAFITFVKGQILNGQPERLEKMLMSGWSFWPVSKEQARNVSTELEDFITKLPELQSKITSLHKAIKEDECRDVQNILDRKKLILAADRSGLPPFHKAVLYGQTDIVTWLLAEFKFALEHKDNMGRTVLHYAAGIPDAGHIYAMLKEAGANEDVTDLTGKTPEDYYKDALLLNVMKIRQVIEEQLENPIPEPKHGYSGGGVGPTYIPGQTQSRVPPPTTIDGKYVATHLGTALTLALSEIAERRPWDPIEYLGQWLYKYRNTMDYIDQQQKALASLRSEVEEKKREEECKKRRLEELKTIMEEERLQREREEEERKRKEQEELQRKAREADLLAQRPNLDTVTEEGEDDVMAKDKDGQTELHRLAGQEGSDLTALLKLGYSLADRDVNFKTARDIAVEKGLQDNVDAIDNYVKEQIEKSKFDMLIRLMLEGYTDLQSAINKLPLLPQQSEEVEKFINETVPKVQDKCKLLLTGILGGSLDEVKDAAEGIEFEHLKGHIGQNPIHMAVFHQRNDILQYLASTYPKIINGKDGHNRTPLHYAMGLGNEEIISTLTANGADLTIKDMKQRDPTYYKENPDEIKSFVQTLTSRPKPSTQEAQGQEPQQGQGQTQDGSEGQTTLEQTSGEQPTNEQSQNEQSTNEQAQNEQSANEGTVQITSGGDQSQTEQTPS